MTRTISVLGATGSIGDHTLDLLRRSPKDDFKIIALSAYSNSQKLIELAKEFRPEYIALGHNKGADILRSELSGLDVEIGIGREAVIEAGARAADFTMCAIIGAAGLEPSLAAVKRGKTIALANKECLVCAGDLFMSEIAKSGATLLPVDSEHNAIFQVLEHDKPEGMEKLILTASGGPFRETPIEKLRLMTPQQALNHPVWNMGDKITIDSATLINKGLELIEACYLFDCPEDKIDVVVHPQSIIHSMVEYIDGSVLAQMGSPDMRTPIAYALGYPNRMNAPVKPLKLSEIGNLSFFEPDIIRFPGLRLAREAMQIGGHATNIFNASNEVAVAAFLSNKIGFMDIPAIVEKTLDSLSSGSGLSTSLTSLSDVLSCDEMARITANEHILTLK